MTSLSQNWVKQAQSCISSIESDRKIKINISWNFEVGSLFVKSLPQNIAVLTPLVTSLTQNWSKSAQTPISCTNDDRKMKIESKRNF